MQSPVAQHSIVAIYSMHPLRLIAQEVRITNVTCEHIPAYTFHELEHVQSGA
jgi:hypothetical protein